MRTTVTFLMASLAILLVSSYVTGSAVLHSDLPQSWMAPLALLGTLGFARRTRRMRQTQAM